MPLHGSITSDRITIIVKNRLNEFNLDIENHIVGVTTDGASVMTKFGKNYKFIHQLCHSHGAYLAVNDVMYSKCDSQSTDENEFSEEFLDEEIEDTDANKEIDDWDDFNEPLILNDEESSKGLDDSEGPQISGYFKDVIRKVKYLQIIQKISIKK